jgi:hypothetical protein
VEIATISYFVSVDNTNEIINELHSEAARLLKQKSSEEFVVSSLMAKGIDQHYAEMIVENVKSDESDRKEFYKHLFGGAFVLLAGIILTLGNYSLAVPGGMYLVFWGFMVYGIITILRAFIIFRK